MLISHNVDGNIHAAVDWCNKMGLSDFVLTIHPVGSHRCVVVFKSQSREDQRYIFSKTGKIYP